MFVNKNNECGKRLRENSSIESPDEMKLNDFGRFVNAECTLVFIV